MSFSQQRCSQPLPPCLTCCFLEWSRHCAVSFHFRARDCLFSTVLANFAHPPTEGQQPMMQSAFWILCDLRISFRFKGLKSLVATITVPRSTDNNGKRWFAMPSARTLSSMRASQSNLHSSLISFAVTWRAASALFDSKLSLRAVGAEERTTSEPLSLLS